MSAIEYPVVVDADDLTQQAFARLQAAFPGWEPNEGNLDVVILEATASMASEVAQVAADLPAQVMRQVGALFGIMPLGATAAVAVVGFDVLDDAGHVIPAGTLLEVTDPAGTGHGFTTDTDLVILPGATSGSVSVTATEPGAASSGIAPQDGNTVCVDALGYVQTTELLVPTAGGADAEDDAIYLARLAVALRLLAPRPILPDDFAALARQVPGVGRAMAIDLYDPGPPVDAASPRTVSVVVADEAGNDVPAVTKAAVATLLQAAREVNFQVFVLGPTYTAVAVTAEVVARPGYALDDVEARTEATVEAYLSGASWGADDASDDPGRWEDRTVVRYLDVAAQVLMVDGVDHITTLELDGGTADVNLAGPGALPAGTATVTATP